MYKHFLYSLTLWPSYLAFVDKNSTAIASRGPKTNLSSPGYFDGMLVLWDLKRYVHSRWWKSAEMREQDLGTTARIDGLSMDSRLRLRR